MNTLFEALILTVLIGLSAASNHVLHGVGSHLSNIDIECNSNNILVTVETSDNFNGMIYPKGLSTNSTCLREYEHAGSKIRYKLPLRSCNTMSHYINEDSNGSGIEYFNTVVIQPHNKLVTKDGKGFNVRCRYQTKDKKIDSDFGVSTIGLTPLIDAEQMPNCIMKIFIGRPDEHHVADHVKIGDLLTLTISIDEQHTYGMKVTNCIVRDGLGLSEQALINNDGCPLDQDIMGNFEYSKNLTSGHVTFTAHKFASTPSVYYQCGVKLCYKKNGGCDDVPPICEMGNNVRRRRKRQNELRDLGNLEEIKLEDENVRFRSVEVYSGLIVNEVDEEDDIDNPTSLSSRSDDEFCVSTRKFAIGIAVAGILLSLAIILLVACIVHRRRRRKGSSTAGSSIYSGPYSNHAYSRD